MSQRQYDIQAIGTITTPFRQKFAIPRQPNLVNAPGQIRLYEAYASTDCLKGIESFSHLWLLFIFHQTRERGWKPRVKAPRLGGNATLGVFASRSTHRPNAIGMSVVRNCGVRECTDGVFVDVEGVDLVSGTPVVDIKPYLPYADAIPGATDALPHNGDARPLDVDFLPSCHTALGEHNSRFPGYQTLLKGILEQDPRPAYRHKLRTDEKTYFVALYDTDVCWTVREGVAEVHSITQIRDN